MNGWLPGRIYTIMLEAIFIISLLLVAYTYAGYPLVLALLPKRKQVIAPFAGETPSVTLLIAAYNEEDVIGDRLVNALALDYPREKLQILVAADGSDDGTAAIVAGYAEQGVELSYHPERTGKMAAINRAMAQARGEIVAFSDANNHYEPTALRALVAPFASGRVGAASGAKRIERGDGALGDSEGLYWRYEEFIKKQETALGTTTGVCGEILAIRRSLFRPPPPTTINDDFYIAMDLIRRGYGVVYVPEARSYERVSPTVRDERGRRSRIVAGRYQAMLAPELWPRRPLVVWQLISHKYLRPLVPVAMLAALASNLLLVARSRKSLLGNRALPLLLSQLLFYAAAALGARLEKSSGPGKLLFLPAFLVSSNLAAFTGLIRFLRGSQGTRWQRVPRRPAGNGSEVRQ
jgi:poly-beta-1,6-N-acetyl-D-glucosamine synthase